MNVETLLTTKETAARVRLAEQTLRTMRCRGDGPPFIKLSGNRVAYSPQDVSDWIAGRRVMPAGVEKNTLEP